MTTSHPAKVRTKTKVQLNFGLSQSESQKVK